MGIANDTELILSLGRLHRIKGLDHLIAAFSHVTEKEPNTLLIIAGPDDGDLQRLRHLADALDLQDRVFFPGALYGASKLSAYVDADVVAAPAPYEIFGLVPFEAIMCGTPVVVNQNSASGLLVDESGAGYLVPDGDIGALDAAIQKVLAVSADSSIKVEAGQNFVRRRLDWDVLVKDLEDLYAGAPAPQTGGTRAQWGLN
jgi:glycosyltransferase involved in cell wall biosynthesis